jgi:hypothetical protein
MINRAKIPQKDACGCCVRIFTPTCLFIFRGFMAGGFAVGMLRAFVGRGGSVRFSNDGLYRAAAR